ncbi:MAG TPA: sulfite exporter TauE/SafE family protein [Methylocystis sp.]|nr:sulfite exporter TauE/SafE family protein [Methylocystis sp.]
MSEASVTLHAHGMHCHGCEHIIEAGVGKLAGVRSVKADYPTETVVVAFDPALTDLVAIRTTIERAGYRTFEQGDPKRLRGPLEKFFGLLIGVIGILLIIFFDTEWISKGGEPDIAQHMSLGLIFLLGLLTGFHCVGMCGGFVLSYTADDASAGRTSYLSHALYGAGKTISYTVIGATFGLLGAFIAFTPMLRGVAGMLAGAFLIVFGLNMLGLFAPLRRFRLGLPGPVQNLIYAEEMRSRHRPFVIGLLNGLMIACGPLQAMYVMAAGTGSALEGAKMLFAFGVGTLPVLLSFGVLATLISSALTHRLLRLSGAIVVILGAVMINRGLILTGSGYDLRSVIATLKQAGGAPAALPQDATAAARPRPAFQTIEMDVIESGYTPNHFVLLRGVPVKWVINGKEVTPCNHRIVVPSLNLEFDVKPGLQTIEFTPDKAGHIPWSCWMGMKHGDFDVIEEAPAATPPVEAVAAAPSPAETAASPPKEAAVAKAAPNERYTIVKGDTLRSIALKVYHDASRWREIAAANPGVDARRLRPGQVLRLPVSAKERKAPSDE